MEDRTMTYAGFWIRLLANIIDVIIVFVIMLLVAFVLILMFDDFDEFSEDVFALFTSIFYFVYLWGFMHWHSATPGKMLFKLKILDASTGEEITGNPWQSFIRLIAFFIPMLLLTVVFDKKKQGWHDKGANTLVVKIIETRKKESVTFNE